MAFYRLMPFGPDRDNYHAGIIASTVANVHRSKGAKSLSPEDFLMMTAEQRREKQTRQFIAALKAVAREK